MVIHLDDADNSFCCVSGCCCIVLIFSLSLSMLTTSQQIWMWMEKQIEKIQYAFISHTSNGAYENENIVY